MIFDEELNHVGGGSGSCPTLGERYTVRVTTIQGHARVITLIQGVTDGSLNCNVSIVVLLDFEPAVQQMINNFHSR